MTTVWQRLRQLFTPATDAPPDGAAVTAAIAEVRAANLSYCGPPKLENVAEAALAVRAANVRGSWLEAGVALGGSAILLGRLKPRGVPLDLYDVFGMIPPPGAGDGEDAHRRYAEIVSGASKGLGGDTYYGYVDDLQQKVIANLRRFDVVPERDRVRLHPGLFEATLRPAGPVALAHVDCDWYDSVRVCIERIAPQMPVGGIVVFDDYSSYSGCRRAVDEWLATTDDFAPVFHRRSLGVRRAR
ncbi:MAG: class I SAM-dependent methyltransferase [Planctomycetes bacterium]|nr:class I SAM-dependent methyltransferase [Planctomycetota bacterium]